MRGSFRDNEVYCSKENKLVEFGVKPVGRGGRSDREVVYELLKDGANDLQIMETDFAKYCRFMKGIDRFRALCKPQQAPKEVYLFYGPPGCGKTELALAQFKDSYRMPIGKGFWFTPTALNAKHVVIDDFKSNISLCDLLQLLDVYPIEVEVKGGHLWWSPETLIITTNRSPHDWYDFSTRDFEKQALFRRFTGMFRFSKNDEKIPKPIEIEDMYNPQAFKDPVLLTIQTLRGPDVEKIVYL